MEKKTIKLGGIEAAANLDKVKEMIATETTSTTGSGFSLQTATPEKTADQLAAEEKELEAKFWQKVETDVATFAAEYVTKLKTDGVDLTPSGEKEVIERIIAGFSIDPTPVEEGIIKLEGLSNTVSLIPEGGKRRVTDLRDILVGTGGVFAIKIEEGKLLYKRW